jgi:hypothetical protein
MADALPDVERPPISHSLALALEEALLAITRLDTRVSASLVTIGWTQRAAWSGYTRALQLQGAEIDEIDVFSWGCGLPLPSRPRRPSHSDEFADFPPWLATLRSGAGPQWRDRLPFTPTIPVGSPRLLGGLSLCHSFARREASIRPWLALPDILRGLGLTASALPCLVGGAKAFRWRATLSDEILRPILRALANAAEAAGDRLAAMEADHRRGIVAVREEYRGTSLTRLLALISVRPLLSPQSTAEALDLTLGGAGKLLGRAADLKLLVEVSGRRAWRLYLAPDLAVSFGLVAAPRGRPPSARVEPIPDRSLSDALDAFDREMADIDRRLGGIAASPTSIDEA